jgi:hypothetical protein
MPKRRTSAKRPIDKPYQVFISHATADKWLAKALCEKIEEAGATSFRDDRDIHGGDDIPDEIRRQIKKSKELVVLLTPESSGRTWLTLEIGAAWGWSKRIRIVLVLCHIAADSIPVMLKNKKAISLNEIDQYFVELKHRVRSYHG